MDSIEGDPVRRTTLSRTAVGVVAGTLTVLFAAGCSVSVGSKEVKKDEVASQASDALAKQTGKKPDDVSCQDDLKAKVGATVRCELTSGGTKYGMTVTAKSVDDDKVQMAFKVDDAPSGGQSSERPDPASSAGASGAVAKAEVARQGKAALAAQAGRQPDAFSCPEDLPARVGATVRCQLAADGKQYGVTVTAASVDGGKVNMDFKVDETPGG